MGLENTSFALANADVLWIDPLDYREDLAVGVDILATAGVEVSVYNGYVLARSAWPYAVQSISDWMTLPQARAAWNALRLSPCSI